MCPIHIAPALRNRELAQESAGLIVTINSDGYNQIVSAENAGLRPKNNAPAASIGTFKFNGNSFDAKE